MIDLKGKTALITGSSRGIGQQIALGLAGKGCNVIVHGRSPENSGKTLKLLNQYPITAYSVHGELTGLAGVEALIRRVKALGVPVDVLYNNAAISTKYRTDIWAHTWEEWARSFDVNVFSMYEMCKAFIPVMVAQKFGRVINVTSGIGLEPELMPYGATKWAVNKLTYDIASRLENTGVRANTLDPGWLRTDLGGEHAPNPVEAVLPGALEPAMVEDDGPNGQHFTALG